jgi:hypothetical protein
VGSRTDEADVTPTKVTWVAKEMLPRLNTVPLGTVVVDRLLRRMVICPVAAVPALRAIRQLDRIESTALSVVVPLEPLFSVVY